MTNAEKFKEVFGFDEGLADANNESFMCREKKECEGCGYFGNLLWCAHFWNSEYSGTPTIPLSVIEDIKTELPDHSFWQDAGGEPLVAIRDVIEIIDRKVKEVTQ